MDLVLAIDINQGLIMKVLLAWLLIWGVRAIILISLVIGIVFVFKKDWHKIK